jgi:peptidoglycan/xylan/chitin deacetylase (PgdA/CDA1 family)
VRQGRLFEALIPRRVIGFCYHTVSDRPLPHVQNLYRCKSAAQFRRDLEYIDRRYRVIGYGDLGIADTSARGKPCAVITFDDGLVECHDVIRPILLELGMPAIFFITSDFVDNRALFYRQKVALAIDAYTALAPVAATAIRRSAEAAFRWPELSPPEFLARLKAADWKDEPAIDATCALLGIDIEAFLRDIRPYMSRAQVRSLAADGFTIGAHGTAHHLMGAMTASEARAEILAACAATAAIVPAPVVPFAFPFNGRGVDRGMLQALRQSDPHIGVFFDSRNLAPDRDFVINRLVVDDPKGSTASASNLSGSLRRAYVNEIVRKVTPLGRRN